MNNQTKKAVSEKQLVFTVEGNEDFPTVLNEIFNCIKFWNNEGLDCHINNNPNYKTGEQYEDFILRMIACDCATFCKGSNEKEPLMPTCKPDTYITGKGGNHVWVARKADNERILIINF